MPSRKSILKKFDYKKLNIVEVDFLPPHFGRDLLFVLSPLGASSFLSKSKPMDGMDKRYDGHVWTKI